MSLHRGRVCSSGHTQSKARGVAARKSRGWGRRRAQPVDDLGKIGRDTGVPQEGTVVHKLRCPNPRWARSAPGGDRGPSPAAPSPGHPGFRGRDQAEQGSARGAPSRRGECDPVPSADTDAPGDDHATTLRSSAAAGPPDPPGRHRPAPRRARPTSSAWAGAAIRAWRDDLTLVLESLSYARAILAADVAILRSPARTRPPAARDVVDDAPRQPARRARARTSGPSPRTCEDLEPGHRRGPLRPHGPTPGGPPGDGPGGPLVRAVRRAGALAQVEEQLGVLTERQAAVEARLQQIRAVILRRYGKRRRPPATSPPEPGPGTTAAPGRTAVS